MQTSARFFDHLWAEQYGIFCEIKKKRCLFPLSQISKDVLFWYQYGNSGVVLAPISRIFKGSPALIRRYLVYSKNALFVLSDCTCVHFLAGNFSSTLHMVYVIFAHSHLYFKNPHLMTHFFCLAHSAVRILVSTSYKVPGCLTAIKKRKEKKKKQEENKWDCYINWTLKHFRSSGCLPSLHRSAEQYSGPSPQAHRRLEFLLWYGCLD